MGPVRSFIESLDNSNQQMKAAKQAVQVGVKMIEQRFRNFEAEFNLPVGQVSKLPSKYLVCTKKQISVKMESNAGNITKGISEIVSSFSSGNVAKGIQKILDSSLKMILGAYSGGYNQSQDYMVVTNLLGGIYRIDYLVVQHKYQAQGIKKHCEDVFGSYLVISSIDKKDITDDNVYRVLVDRQFSNRKMKDKLTLLKMVKGEELTQAEMTDIYEWKYHETDEKQKENAKDPPVTQQSFESQQQFFEQEWKEREFCIKTKAEIDREAEALSELQRKVEEAKLKIIERQSVLAKAEEDIVKRKKEAEIFIKQSELKRLRLQIEEAKSHLATP